MRRDYSKKYTANNTITAVRAMQQYLLSPSDLESLKQIKIRSPYDSSTPIFVYLEKDVEDCAIKVSVRRLLLVLTMFKTDHVDNFLFCAAFVVFSGQ